MNTPSASEITTILQLDLATANDLFSAGEYETFSNIASKMRSMILQGFKLPINCLQFLFAVNQLDTVPAIFTVPNRNGRKVVLDVETTGLDALKGHKIIEIGCVEIIDRQITGRIFHTYLNPGRAIDAGAFRCHGISSEFLSDKPVFKEIQGDLYDFILGAELIIHNAPFDMGFLNTEIGPASVLTDHCSVFDTLAHARSSLKSEKYNLDALCELFGIDNSHRTKHGAILDSEILAEVYLKMTEIN